jgi:hypothetical protein
VSDSNFTIISVAIKKYLLKEQYAHNIHPYHFAMSHGLEKIIPQSGKFKR